jgi:hypothetical protein
MKRQLFRIIGFFVFLSFLSGQIVIAQGERVFFGNLHSHTSYSDGSGTPREAFLYARDTAKTHFLALTEHNHSEALGDDGIGIGTNSVLYKGPGAESLIPVATALSQNDRFIALYGQEFSTISSGNHVNVFDIGEVINVQKGRFDLLTDFLQTNKDSSGKAAVIMLNHPDDSLDLSAKEYGLDDFGGDSARWVSKIGAHASLIQLINGPGMDNRTDQQPARPKEEVYHKFLNLGFKLAPTADQDNHRKNWGNATTARTAAVMPALNKANLINALRNRHVYATEDPNLSVVIKVNNKLTGDVIAPLPAAGELSISYRIEDPDEPDAEYEIQIWRDSVGGNLARMVSSVLVDGGSGTIEDVAFSGEAQFFFFKIIQRNESGDVDRAWTSPVWFEAGGGTSTPNPQPEANTAVASRNSQVFHVSLDCLDAQKIKPANRLTGAAARQGRRLHQDCPRRN